MSTEPQMNRVLQAVADPMRRRILEVLKQRGAGSINKEMGLCASDIQERVHLSQPTVSHHMAVLRKAGLVEAKKQGLWVLYRRNETTIRELARFVREKL